MAEDLITMSLNCKVHIKNKMIHARRQEKMQLGGNVT